MPRRLDAREAGFAQAFEELLNLKRASEEDVAAVARAIVADVRARGDEAVAEYTKRFDKPDTGHAEPTAEVLEAIDTAAARIEAYHRRQLPKDESFTDE